MKASTRNAMRKHAIQEFPKEATGFVVVTPEGEKYIPAVNIAEQANDMVIVCPKSQAKAYKAGEVVAFFHSHPNHPAKPSEADLVGCERMGLPWYIQPLNDHGGALEVGELITVIPSGYKAPLIGRSFSHGVLDCYTLIRDYYDRELGIGLPDFQRDDEWWNKGQNLYEENFAKAGFVPVHDLKPHDVILMQYYSEVTNHAGVLIGDYRLKSEHTEFNVPDAMIHHASNRLSERVIYGGYWADITRMVLRHKDLL